MSADIVRSELSLATLYSLFLFIESSNLVVYPGNKMFSCTKRNRVALCFSLSHAEKMNSLYQPVLTIPIHTEGCYSTFLGQIYLWVLLLLSILGNPLSPVLFINIEKVVVRSTDYLENRNNSTF